MTSREITESAFNLKKAERTPVTLIAGGEWYFHHAGAVFGQVKTDPQALAEVFVKGLPDHRPRHDLARGRPCSTIRPTAWAAASRTTPPPLRP